MAGDIAAAAAIKDHGDQAAYLAEVCQLLWPDPARICGTGAGTSEFLVLPGLTRPRLVVPAGRRASAAAVRRYGEPGSCKTFLATRGLALFLRSGIGAVMLRDRLRVQVPDGAPTIETYLRTELGADVRVSMHLGAARANRKPVLQLLTASGDTVGFAKIGVNRLTRDLVRAELGALTRLGRSGLSSLSVPAVLHSGSWAGLDVLVLSPLPVWQRRTRLPAGRLVQAMREVAGVAGISRDALAASAYWRTLTTRLAGADDTADRGRLQRALGEVETRAGDAELCFGACHGDWTPWNMASTPSGLHVWDWERFTMGVPLGFDVLHHWLQTQVVSLLRDPPAAAADCAARSPGLLAPLGIGDARARLTAALYLADLATRYLADRQADEGRRLGAPGWWLIPAVAGQAARL